MLSLRLLMSAVLIPAVAGLFLLDARFGAVAPIFGLLIIALGVVLASEMVTMLRHRVPKLSRGDVLIVVGTVVGLGWVSHAVPSTLSGEMSVRYSGRLREWMRAITYGIDGTQDNGSVFLWLAAVIFAVGLAATLTCLMGLIWLTIAAIRVERGSLSVGEVVPLVSAKLFIVTYIGGMLLLTSQLRWISVDAYQGLRFLAMLLIATKLGDVGGYFAGRYFGRSHPLKTLSPKKTGAGFIGAIVTGSTSTAAWLVLTEPYMRGELLWLLCVVYGAIGLLLSVMGILGDLVESLIKRDVGVKDASSSLPGFGGFLDLLDSPLFTGAVLVAVLVGGLLIGLLFST